MPGTDAVFWIRYLHHRENHLQTCYGLYLTILTSRIPLRLGLC